MRSIVARVFVARRGLVSSHRCAGDSTCAFVNYTKRLNFSFSSTANASHKLYGRCRSLNTEFTKREPIACIDFQPLCERPAVYKSTVDELLKWRRWAQDMAMAVGDKYCLADGGPDSQELLRELEWMLEDAVSHATTSGVQPEALKCMPNSVGHFSTTDRVSLGAKTHTSPCGTPLETGKEMRDNSLKGLRWQDIKNFELQYHQRIVGLRASLEELSSLWTERVQQRRPFQYVVGCAHWRDYVLCVKEGVLIPRPETEQMIDLAEEVIKAQPDLSKGLWADLGTGSGALAIGLGCLLHPQGTVVAVDISNEAISVASLNVQRYGLQNKVKVLEGSWFSALWDKRGKLAGVLSNPPYIPSSHIASLQAEVGQYEPRNALDGGQQGTSDLITICQGATWALQSDGCILLETNGGGQAEIVAGFLESMPGAPFYDIQLIKDFAGIVRFVKARRV